MKTLIGFIILAIYIAIPIIIASLVGGLLYIISESSALTFLGVLGGGWVGIMIAHEFQEMVKDKY